MIVYTEDIHKFLGKLEKPHSSRYFYRLVEITLPGYKETPQIEDLLEEIRGNNIDDYFKISFNKFPDSGDIFVNDIFMSKIRYSIVLQLYIKPWATLEQFAVSDQIHIEFLRRLDLD